MFGDINVFNELVTKKKKQKRVKFVVKTVNFPYGELIEPANSRTLCGTYVLKSFLRINLILCVFNDYLKSHTISL